MRTVLATLLSASAIPMMMTSCGWTSPSSSDLVVITYQPSGMGGDMATLEGAVDVDASSGCVRILQDGNARAVVPRFPENEITTDRSSFSYRGDSYSDGDEIELVGGFVPEEDQGQMGGDCGDAGSPVFIVTQEE